MCTYKTVKYGELPFYRTMEMDAVAFPSLVMMTLSEGGQRQKRFRLPKGSFLLSMIHIGIVQSSQ